MVPAPQSPAPSAGVLCLDVSVRVQYELCCRAGVEFGCNRAVHPQAGSLSTTPGSLQATALFPDMGTSWAKGGAGVWCQACHVGLPCLGPASAGAAPLPESGASMRIPPQVSGHRSTIYGNGTAHPSRGRRLSVGRRARRHSIPVLPSAGRPRLRKLLCGRSPRCCR